MPVTDVFRFLIDALKPAVKNGLDEALKEGGKNLGKDAVEKAFQDHKAAPSQPVQPAAQPSKPAAPQPPAAPARLLIMRGQSAQAQVALTANGLLLGRESGYFDPDPNDTSISHKHARIFWYQGQFWIQDTQSRNGTKVNDQRIVNQQPLHRGDRIQIGNSTMQFQ